jgi:hypothetical protein
MKRVLSLLLALILVMTASPAAPAQTNNSGQSATSINVQDWQDLQGLKPGKKILVEFKSNLGDPVEGRFVSAVGTKLTLTSDGYTRSLEQRDIQSVYHLKGRWSRATTGRIGMVVGAVLGGLIDNTLIHPMDRPVTPTDDGTPSVGGVILGAVAGAGVGRLFGGKRKGKLLYEAK